MNIFFIDEGIDKIGGVERVINALANNMSSDYNITVISKTKNRDTPFYEYDKNINIIYLWDNTVLLSNKVKSKLLFYVFKVIEKVLCFFVISYKVRCVSKSIKENDRVVFGRIHTSLDFFPYFKKRKIKPIIIVRDAINLNYFRKKLRKKILYYFPDYVNHFIVSSDESIKEYNKFFKEKKVEMVKIYNPLGIRPEAPSDYKKLYFNKKIISIGRMDDDQKGFSSLIKAFHLLHKKKCDWKLEIYGDGKYKKVYESLISSLNAKDYITIKKSTKDVVSVFNNASIFVSTSRFEGYANILVESLSCGLPCVSFNWKTGVDEIIKNNYNGFVVRLSDREGYYRGNDCDDDYINLSEALIKIIDDKELYNKFFKNSKYIVSSREVKKIVNQWKILLMKND